MMTDFEAIEAARLGNRACTVHSLRDRETPDPRCYHSWRTIACNSETDVIECSECGRQELCECDFDDEFA